LVKVSGFEINDTRGAILFEHLSMPQKLDTLGSLGHELSMQYSNLKDLPKAISNIRSAYKLRNDFVHHSLTLSDEGDYLEMPVASARGKLKAEVKKVTLVNLKRAVIEISNAQRGLYKVLFQQELKEPWQ
jgi:predicted NUDIX family NTP pyrophosphohydrolase